MTKTTTVRGCSWVPQVGERLANASRRNGWSGTIVKVLGTKTTMWSSWTPNRDENE